MTVPGFGPGEVVDGRYRIEATLGGGGMGVVLRALDLGRNVPVAIKVLGAAFSLEADASRRFEREATLAAHVDREPGVVRAWSAGRHRGRQFLVMELVEGEDLARVFARSPGPEELARLMADVARTVGRCHARGVVHRDLKPGNVLVRAADGAPLLTDFGMAWAASAERLTRTGELLGTPAYMAPEQVRDASRAVDPAVDVYALGAILYHGLSGRPPFEGRVLDVLRRALEEPPVAPSTLRPGVPVELEALCLRALAKDPAARPPSADAFADALEGWLAAGAPAGRRRGTRALIGLALGALALGVVALGVAARRGASTPPSPVADPIAVTIDEALNLGRADPVRALRQLDPLLGAGGPPRARQAAAALWRAAMNAPTPGAEAVAGYLTARRGALAGEDLADVDARVERLRVEESRDVARRALTHEPVQVSAARDVLRGLAQDVGLEGAGGPTLKASAFDEDADAWADALRVAWAERAERATALLEVLGLALRAGPAARPGPRLTAALDAVTDAFAASSASGDPEALRRVVAFDRARLRLVGPAAPPGGLRDHVHWALLGQRGVVPWLIAAGLRCGFVPNNIDRALADEVAPALATERSWSRAARYVEFRRERERIKASGGPAEVMGAAYVEAGLPALAPGLAEDLAPRFVGDVHAALAQGWIARAEALAGPTRRRSPEVLAFAAAAAAGARSAIEVDPLDSGNFREGWRTMIRAIALLHGPEALAGAFAVGVQRCLAGETSEEVDEIEHERWRAVRGALHVDRAAQLARWGDPERALDVLREGQPLLGEPGVRARAAGHEATLLLGLGRLEEAEAALAPFLPEGLAESELACPAIEVAARRGLRDLALERLAEARRKHPFGADVEALARRLGLGGAR